jgi:hypothetical protein
VGLGGDDLPQGGEDLPVAVPGGSDGQAPLPADHGGGRPLGRFLREQLLASLPMLVRMPMAVRAAGHRCSRHEHVPGTGGGRGPDPPDQAPAAAAAGIVAATGDSSSWRHNPPSRPAASLPRVFQMDVPLQQPGWDRALGERVRWMANEKVQVAELRLNPPNLGPLEVRLHVEGDRTHVNFVAPQAAVREAIDAALPRLRELFAEGGLELG